MNKMDKGFNPLLIVVMMSLSPLMVYSNPIQCHQLLASLAGITTNTPTSEPTNHISQIVDSIPDRNQSIALLKDFFNFKAADRPERIRLRFSRTTKTFPIGTLRDNLRWERPSRGQGELSILFEPLNDGSTDFSFHIFENQSKILGFSTLSQLNSTAAQLNRILQLGISNSLELFHLRNDRISILGSQSALYIELRIAGVHQTPASIVRLEFTRGGERLENLIEIRLSREEESPPPEELSLASQSIFEITEEPVAP